MPIRDIQLPADLIPLGEMVVDTFQYPENPEWSVQADEQEDFASLVKNLARLWPIIRFGQLFSTSLRDLIRGCIWEEDGKMVGCTMVQRRGSTNVWIVSTVGVLPEYRRRGLARKLIERQGCSVLLNSNVVEYAFELHAIVIDCNADIFDLIFTKDVKGKTA